MKQLIMSTAVTAILSIMLAACSGENKPTTSEMKATLTQSMPGRIGIDSFSVQATENLGNMVEPIYVSRFKATVIAMADLYKIDKSDKRVTFARLVTAKGKHSDIFGKIASRLYQGAWRHNIDIDGTPVSNLGVPLNQVSASSFIVRGSDEERNYYAEIQRKAKERQAEKERAEAELRKNIANAGKLLIGEWINEIGHITYTSDGSLIIKGDDESESIFRWSVEGDSLNLIGRKYKLKGQAWESNNLDLTYQIEYIDNNNYTLKGVSSRDIKTWHGKRIR